MENNKKTKKEVKKVIKGKAIRKTRVGGNIFAEDFKTVADHIVNEVVIPSIRRTIVDTVCDSISMAFLGEKRSRKKGEYTNYRSYSTESSSYSSYSSRPRYDDIVLPSRSDADAVLHELLADIHEYGVVSIADLYQLIGEKPEYTSNKYGWTSLAGADVIPCRGGYRLKLPRAVLI